MALTPLPIDPLLPDVTRTLAGAPSLVLEAPPGAGKTTRVPRALVEAGFAKKGEIVVLQPRRLPTRLAAQRVAEEWGERVGDTVGYQVRFEDVSSPKTKVRFVTEGVLGRRLLSDATIPDVAVVVLDEFHERHLAGDVGLALLKHLQSTRRPDLKLVVMSATLEAAPIAAYLDGAPRLRSEGRRFEVAIEHLAAADARHLDQQILAALKRKVQEGLDGDVLVFLPGAGEIRRARETCEDFASRHGLRLLPLHGDLSPEEQDRAVRPGEGRKVILSTNVAETSVTIEGVVHVIDSGLARVASHSPWSGLPSLKLSKISRASAVQRAGRAGRTRPGSCLRLYTEHDFLGRPEHDAPEIRRLDLAETVLSLRAAGFTDLAAFPFFEAPPESALGAAEELLRKLGAVGDDGGVTEIGKRMLRFPLHPRLARLLVEGERRGIPSEAALVAALLSERDIRLEARAALGPERRARDVIAGPSDLLELVDRFRNGRSVDAGAVAAVQRVHKQLSRLTARAPSRPGDGRAIDDGLLYAVLTGFPDRVARRRKKKSPEVVFAAGGAATLSDASVVREAELLVGVDAEDRGREVIVRIASAVEPEWLLDLPYAPIEEVDRLEWNAETERVERMMRLGFGAVALEETRALAEPSEEASRILARAALAAGLERFVAAETLAAFEARLELLRGAFPEAGFGGADTSALEGALTSACAGARSFAELEGASLAESLVSSLSSKQAALFAREAPERITLPGGRGLRVNYEKARPPWVESRLQDFFGMRETPKIAGGRVALVLHLLAPNGRAVQVTTDLAGFWERHYPGIRRELMRQYPRHSWPDDPLTASPPPPSGRRR